MGRMFDFGFVHHLGHFLWLQHHPRLREVVVDP